MGRVISCRKKEEKRQKELNNFINRMRFLEETYSKSTVEKAVYKLILQGEVSKKVCNELKEGCVIQVLGGNYEKALERALSVYICDRLLELELEIRIEVINWLIKEYCKF